MNLGKLKGYLFWIVSGSLLVIWIALFALVLLPKKDEYSVIERNVKYSNVKLQDLKRSGVPSTKDAAKWKHYRESLVQEGHKLIKFYLEKDLALEKWFERDWDPYKLPNQGDFLAKWETRKGILDDANKIPGSAGNPGASGWKWEAIKTEEMSKVPAAEVRFDIMKELQKSFWIRVKIWEAVKPIVEQESKAEGAKRVTEVVDVGFLESVYDKIRTWAPGVAQEFKTPGSDFPTPQKVTEGYPGIPQSREFAFPGTLGRTITFGVTVRTHLGEVPNFLSRLLSPPDPSAEAPILLIELLGARIEPSEVNPFMRTVDVPEGQVQEKMKEYRQEIIPASVAARLTCRVLDFDKKKLEELEKVLSGETPAR